MVRSLPGGRSINPPNCRQIFLQPFMLLTALAAGVFHVR